MCDSDTRLRPVQGCPGLVTMDDGGFLQNGGNRAMTSQRASLKSVLMTFGLVLSSSAVGAATGPAHLLKDINQIPSSNRGSFPEDYQRLGEIALFHARTPQTGMELWRTDGTEAGTFLVKDIAPGPAYAFNYPGFDRPDDPFVELGGALIFLADDGVHGFELWRSDGTEAGTRMVKEIRPGPQSSFAASVFVGADPLLWRHVVAGGTMYFLANDGVHGFELWITDGTEAGTFLLKDILPGSVSAFAHAQFLVGEQAGGFFFFRANDGTHGSELWKTDGTPAGTVLVKDVRPGAADSFPGDFTELNGNLLFTAHDGASGPGLWRSDGTESGTVQITAATPWPFQTYPRDLIRANGAVYFGISNSGWLYRTDGTEAGTIPVRQFASEVSPLREWNGFLLLTSDDGIHGRELWRSDGTEVGTLLVKDIVPGSASSPGFFRFTEAGRELFFFADDGVHGLELWVTDGTEAGTFLVKDITPGTAGSDAYYLVGVEGTLFFSIADADYHNALRLWNSDGTEAGTRAVQCPPVINPGTGFNGALLFSADDVTHGVEVWRSDGTDAGTTLVKDIHPSFVTEWSDTEFLGVVSVPGIGERMFFRADDGVHGQELWVTDGKRGGTRLVKDIRPGTPSSSPSPGIAHDGAFFFAAFDGVHGYELWRSDGTEAGTVMIADIFPGPSQGMQGDSTFGELGDSVYFAADDSVHGRTLWKSNGTEAGTLQVADIDLRFSFPNAGSNSIYPITIGETLYFVANDPAHGVELWKTDGTEAGTVLVKDLSPGPASSAPSMFVDFHGTLVLIAQDPNHGYEPWLSDGTEAGTNLIKDIFLGRTASQRRLVRPVALGDSVYFPATRDSTHGEGLWKTDGTEAGTLLVKEVGPGFVSFNDSLTVLDGALYFVATIPSLHAFELWRSDGTAAGTHAVKTGLAGSSELLAVDGRGLVFVSADSDHGYELWRSDGTESGSVLAQDIVPGPDHSIPRAFAPLGNRLLFLATDGIAGEEPWFARTAILFGRPDQAIEDLKGEVKLLRLPRGIETSLSAILNAAAWNLSANRTVQAILLLESFGTYLEALTPGQVSEASAADLEEFTAEIVSLLEAP